MQDYRVKAVRESGRSNLLVVSGLMMLLALVAITVAYGLALKQYELVERESTCLQHASRIAGALERYALEHNGMFPRGWNELIGEGYLPRTGDFYRCPLDRNKYTGEPSHSSTTYEVRWGLNLLQLDRNIQRKWLSGFEEKHFTDLLIYHKGVQSLARGHRHPSGFRQLSANIYNRVMEQFSSTR